MAVLLLPLQAEIPHYSFEIELEQRAFLFEFRWNDRARAWFLDVQEPDGTPIVSGRRVVVDVPLLSRYRDPRLPLGDLTAIDTSHNSASDPGFADLGERVRILYFESGDLPAEFRG